MSALAMLTESEMMGDLFRHNIAVQIECDPDSMPGFTCRAYSRLSPRPLCVARGSTLHEAVARLHAALLG